MYYTVVVALEAWAQEHPGNHSISTKRNIKNSYSPYSILMLKMRVNYIHTLDLSKLLSIPNLKIAQTTSIGSRNPTINTQRMRFNHSISIHLRPGRQSHIGAAQWRHAVDHDLQHRQPDQ